MTDERAAHRRPRGVTRALVVVAVAVIAAGCTTASRIPINGLDELAPGRSTKADVERVLGPRAGEGGASFPTEAQPAKPRYEIWYYVDWQKKNVSREVYVMLPRMLLVFFDADTFNGFMWFDLGGAEPASVRGPLSSR